MCFFRNTLILVCPYAHTYILTYIKISSHILTVLVENSEWKIFVICRLCLDYIYDTIFKKFRY